MDVHLLVYDLSGGIARQMSRNLLGFQLDAIYHTSIELQGREYVYDGGIIAIQPGTSHLGQPLERLHLGTTHLPMDIITEYLDSIRSIFTLEAYDLFRHNCNNFTDSFSNFLLGKGIPSHIANMPQAVLDSPLGQMLLPQLTQGVNRSRGNGSILGLQDTSQAPTQNAATPKHHVQNISSHTEFSRLLEEAKRSYAVVFFTSATCPPCKTLYPIYDELAEAHARKGPFMKVDISKPEARGIAEQYSIRATPTIITFLKGAEENRWSGADPAQLRGNVQLLVQMAFPHHPHENLRLPTFSNPGAKPILFSKIPPMAKLNVKMGDELSGKAEVQALEHFIEAREKLGPQDAVLPDMSQLSGLIQGSLARLSVELLFPIIDLFRCALVDPRISGYFAEEVDNTTIRGILDLVVGLDSCPYALRLITLHMACNLFSSPLFPHELLNHEKLRSPFIQLISSSFLDESHNNVRVAAASLLFNLAVANRQTRAKDSNNTLPEADEVELAASVIEAIGQEEKSSEALQGMLTGLGHLVYGAAVSGELADLLRALDAEGTILAKSKDFPNEKLVAEVGTQLIGKGFRRP